MLIALPYAITLRLDPISALTIEEMWQTLASEGIDTDRHILGYAPHIRLAIYPDDVPADRLRAVMAQITGQWHAMPVSLSGIGALPGPSTILWAAPAVTAALLTLQEAIHTALPEFQPHAHYRPGAWVPHVTLSGMLVFCPANTD
jgi:2'-5' RNA ligase